MKVGERGYTVAQAIMIDANGKHWLNLSYEFQPKIYSRDCMPIERVSNARNGYRVRMEDVEFPWHRQEIDFTNDKNNVCLEAILDRSQVTGRVSHSTGYGKNENESDEERRGRILSPFDTVFLSEDTIDVFTERMSFDSLLDGELPDFYGAILSGREGTGKTLLMNSAVQVFKNLGYHTKQIHFAAINDKWVGSIGKQLDEEIQKVIEVCNREDCPALVYADEATSMVAAADDGTTSSRHYEEGIDVLKEYVGNDKRLVFCITTNKTDSNFAKPLIRPGRFEPLKLDYPGENERRRMWNHYLASNNILSGLTEAQLSEFANAIPKQEGAYVDEFCRTYIRKKRGELHKERTKSPNMIEALKKGSIVSKEEVMAMLTTEQVLSDLKRYAAKKRSMRKEKSMIGLVDRK